MQVYQDLYVVARDKEFGDLICQIQGSLAHGWTREAEMEARAKELGLSVMYCFRCDERGTRKAASLSIARNPEGTWYVANIVPTKDGELSKPEYNSILQEFAYDYVIPHAQRSELQTELTPPNRPLSTWVPSGVEEALRVFSRLANHSSGRSHPMDEERWFEFIGLAHKYAADLDPSTLRQWLTEEEGWSEEAALELSADYRYGRALLKHYEGTK